MTQQNDNYETRPAVSTETYEDPPKPDQRAYRWGTTTVIAGLVVIFLAVIVIFVVTS